MEDESTTAANNSDGDANGTTTDQNSDATDQQTANNGDNLDTSKANDSADGGNKNTDSDEGGDNSKPKFDTDLDQWIEKRKLSPATTDEQRQAYQELRNGQREFTRSRQAKEGSTDLHDTVKGAKEGARVDPADDDRDETTKRLDALEEDRTNDRSLRLQSEFYTTNKVTNEEHQAIKEIFKEKVERAGDDSEKGKAAKLKAVDIWGAPEALTDLLDIARARLAKGTDTSTVADEAARKERERIARESNAHSPGRNATTTSTDDKTPEQKRLDALRERYSPKK